MIVAVYPLNSALLLYKTIQEGALDYSSAF